MTRQLVSSDEAVIGRVQHKKACADCPWSRKSIPGWLGSETPEQWLSYAHGEARVECHTLLTQQCAGIAIYRRNMCKTPRDPDALILDADRETVFSNPTEFMTHHSK